MKTLEDLLAYDGQTRALEQIAGRLAWDQETMMAPGSGAQRAQEHAAIERVLHARRCSPAIGDALVGLDAVSDPAQKAMIARIQKDFDRATKVDEDLAAALASARSRAHKTWASAREDEDVAAFLPALSEVLNLRRTEAVAIAGDTDPYDALLQDYEPNGTGAELQAMFDALRPGLVDLRAAILDQPKPMELSGEFNEAAQLALSEKLALAFGYDLNFGRIDKAVHPFSSGSGQDVRITTRLSATDPFNCFYSTIHEVGHACYEQNVNPSYGLTAIGQGASMGVHESQSRIYENQLGRSRAFTGWLFGQMRNAFGDFGVPDEDTFFAVVNRVSDGFIRTEADEVQYNLHVLLRFDLERSLISGDLAVVDLEAAWNDRFLADFGYGVDKPSNGCLQDVHWSEGLFGYFPTYSLGNVYAGCLYQAMRENVSNLDDALAQGDTRGATGWLKENLQHYGSLKTPVQTISDACGFAPNEAPLMSYLKDKFSGIYNL